MESGLGVENGVWGSTINGQFTGLKISLKRELVSSSKSAFICVWKIGAGLRTESNLWLTGLKICLSIEVAAILHPSSNISESKIIGLDAINYDVINKINIIFEIP